MFLTIKFNFAQFYNSYSFLSHKFYILIFGNLLLILVFFIFAGRQTAKSFLRVLPFVLCKRGLSFKKNISYFFNTLQFLVMYTSTHIKKKTGFKFICLFCTNNWLSLRVLPVKIWSFISFAYHCHFQLSVHNLKLKIMFSSIYEVMSIHLLVTMTRFCWILFTINVWKKDVTLRVLPLRVLPYKSEI